MPRKVYWPILMASAVLLTSVPASAQLAAQWRKWSHRTKLEYVEAHLSVDLAASEVVRTMDRFYKRGYSTVPEQEAYTYCICELQKCSEIDKLERVINDKYALSSSQLNVDRRQLRSQRIAKIGDALSKAGAAYSQPSGAQAPLLLAPPVAPIVNGSAYRTLVRSAAIDGSFISVASGSLFVIDYFSRIYVRSACVIGGEVLVVTPLNPMVPNSVYTLACGTSTLKAFLGK